MMMILQSCADRNPGARELTERLGGRWHGRSGTAPCPVCQPQRRRDQRALSLADGRDGRLLLHCFRSGCDWRAILAAAGCGGGWRAPDPAQAARRAAEAAADRDRRARAAAGLWASAVPGAGTPAEAYLRSRGIVLPCWCGTLRFAPACAHGPSGTVGPALVARVDGGDAFAVHRTFLAPDGRGKAGLPGGDKLALGPVAGGAVRLYDPAPGAALVVAEGIETALAAWLLRGDPAAGCWSALSAPGMVALRLPEAPGRLAVAVDGDAAGRSAGRALAGRAWAAGWRVTIADPGDGRDWCDVIAVEGHA